MLALFNWLLTWTLAYCTSLLSADLSSVEQARVNWTLVLLPRLSVPLVHVSATSSSLNAVI